MKSLLSALFLIGMLVSSKSYAQTPTCYEVNHDLIAGAIQSCQNTNCSTNGSVCSSIFVAPYPGGTQPGIWTQGNHNVCSDGTPWLGIFNGLHDCSTEIIKAEQPITVWERSSLQCGSIIRVEDQVLGESIPLLGVNFELVYSSKYAPGQVKGFSGKLKLSDVTPPMDLYSYKVIVSPQYLSPWTTYISPSPNASYNVTWNGKNSSGVDVQGFNRYEFQIEEKYQYNVPPDLIPYEVPYHRSIVLGGFRSKLLGLGGWAPSNYKFLDKVGGRLIDMNGDYRSVAYTTYDALNVYVVSEDSSEVYLFNSIGNITAIKTALLGVDKFIFNYDSSGGLTSIVEPFSKTTTFNRNGSGDLISITAPHGQVTSVTLDANGNLESASNPNLETYQMVYNGAPGILTSFQKPGGQASTFVYDSDFNLTKDSHSGGSFKEVFKNVLSDTDIEMTVQTAMGRNTVIQRSGSGASYNRTTTTSQGLQRLEYIDGSFPGSENFSEGGISGSTVYSDHPQFVGLARYASARNTSTSDYSRTINNILNISMSSSNPFSISTWSQTSAVNGINASVTTIFNPSTKKFSYLTYLGKTAQTEIDSYERVISYKIGSLNATSIGYTNEKITSITQGSNATTIGYNGLGLMNSVTNALSQVTGYVYDNANRIASVVLPDSRVVGYAYDGAGNLVGVTPPSRPIHTFVVNSKGLLGAYEPPVLSGVSAVNTTYDYNLDNQLTSVVRPDGNYLTYNYNLTTGVLETVDTNVGTYTWSFDTNTGLPSSILTPDNVSTQVSYIGRMPSSYYNYVSGVSSGSYALVLDSYGRVDNDTVTAGGSSSTTSSITYLYNDDEDLRKAGDVNITYHVPNGYMTGTTMGSGSTGFTDTYTYNTNGEVTGYQAKRGTTTIYDLSLTRGLTGRIDGKTQVMNSITDAFAYTFDSAGRLTQTDKNSVTVATYSYDNNSNRNGGTIGVQPTTATYDDQDRLLTYNTLSFTYNANGDLATKTNSTTSQTTTYTYDVYGNLKQVNLPPSTVITYEVDGLGRRITKKVGSTVQKRWVYMDQLRIAAELNSSGGITKRFIYGSKGNIPDYMIASGVKYRIISDHLGSPRLVVKQSDGTITQRMNHDEYGRVTEDTNPGFTPFGFAGGLYDNQTGLVRFGARDYDPEVGRWTSKDPIRFNGGDTNLFGYVQNDPVNWIDPEGTLAIAAPAIPWIIEGAAIVAGAIGLCEMAKKAPDYKICSKALEAGQNGCFRSGKKGKALADCLAPHVHAYNRCVKPY